MPQWLNSSSAGRIEPVSSKIFLCFLDLSLPFGYGLIALHFPILRTSGADRVTSQQTYTTKGLEQSSLSHQRQLCPVPAQPESTLPASQEARKDPAPSGGSSVPPPFIWALPPAPCPSPETGRPELCGAHGTEESQDTVGTRKRQNKGRRKGEQSGYCRTSRSLPRGSPRQSVLVQSHSFPLVPHSQHCLRTPVCFQALHCALLPTTESHTKPNTAPRLLSASSCGPIS